MDDPLAVLPNLLWLRGPTHRAGARAYLCGDLRSTDPCAPEPACLRALGYQADVWFSLPSSQTAGTLERRHIPVLRAFSASQSSGGHPLPRPPNQQVS